MIQVEVNIVFWTACFFTLLYIWKRGFIFGLFTWLSWMTVGFLWFFLVAEAPSYSGYAVAFLFHGIGIIFLLVSVLDLLNTLKMKRKGLGDDDTL